jgi:hypothetical protein
MSKRVCLWAAAVVFGLPLAFAQAPASDHAAKIATGARLDVVLERLEAGRWKDVNPQTVLEHGDAIRFRLSPSFPGYLYAYNRGSDGSTEMLFPLASSTSSNRMEPGASYRVPSGSAQTYTVEGKPGFDVVYFMVSPVSLGERKFPTSYDDFQVRTMVPRCKEDQPINACLDPRAGAHAVTMSAPDTKDGAAKKDANTLKARELRLSTTGETSRVETLEGQGLFVYEFRLAHK